ncbi:hypothetical protein [Piscibacillus salipiscarius]|uniref:Uncharacterized protein n=1 Tax=Piscibacillus salipiscarius TaxID=299480 RepID=A0ABW5QEJ2_9BACI|nr:hypothetical protein [Piscibacillus salipiscarius]
MRYLVILLASLMLILAACGSNNSESEESTSGSNQNNEETENTEKDSEETAEASDDELVEEAMNSYNEAMEQFQADYVDGSQVKEFTSVEEVTNYFLENAPTTEAFANSIAEKTVEEKDGKLTWLERDYTVTLEAEEFNIYSMGDTQKFYNFRIAGDAKENRGDYTYELLKEDGKWLVDEFNFGYLDGEYPKEESEEDAE